jgi:hypothetical protein
LCFIIIGGRCSSFPELGGLKNLRFAKDWGGSSEDDMALIQESAAFFGTSSGPATMAIFGSRPYRVFNFIAICEKECMEHGAQYPWVRSNQKLLWTEENDMSLIQEFDEMMSRIDIASWNDTLAKQETADEAALSRRSEFFGEIKDYTNHR